MACTNWATFFPLFFLLCIQSNVLLEGAKNEKVKEKLFGVSGKRSAPSMTEGEKSQGLRVRERDIENQYQTLSLSPSLPPVSECAMKINYTEF